MAIVIGGSDPTAPAHRKLAGFLRAVVSVPAAAAAAGSIRPLAPCTLSACGAVPLAPLPDDAPSHSHSRATTTPRGLAKWRATGGSVLRLLRALAGHRCVEVDDAVLRVALRDGAAEARAVLLLDVYLPVAAWSGWQFPRSRASAWSGCSY